MKREPLYAKKKDNRPLLIAGICAAAAIIGVLIWVFSSFTWVNGTRYSRKETHLDLSGSPISSIASLKGFRGLEELNLRDTGLTPEQYDELAGCYPQCRILWDVPFQGAFVDCNEKSLTVSALSDSDVELLDYFQELETVDATGCMDYAQLAALQSRRPELDLDYAIRLGEQDWPSDSTAVTLADPDGDELLDRLKYLPQLETVALSGELPAPNVLQALRQTYPGVDISWTLQMGSCTLSSEDTAFELSGWPLNNIDDLETLIAYGPKLQTLAVLGTGLSNEDLVSFRSAHSELDFVWDITLGDKTFRTDVEKLDLSNVILNDVSDLESLFPYLPNLNWVDVSFCGLPDEELDAFNRRYEDIRVVWSIYLGLEAYFRTDSIYFMPYKLKTNPKVWVNNLKYCTDLICVDIGHFYNIHNIEFVRTMPHLKYLIIADTGVTSLEPLRGANELIYLEAFMTTIDDFSPLVDCPALLDLNVCQTYGDYEPLKQMTQLERLWIYSLGIPSATAYAAIEELEALMPNAIITYSSWPSDNNWRLHERYYEMRDILEMPYFRY